MPVDIYGLGQIAYQLLCSISWDPKVLEANNLGSRNSDDLDEEQDSSDNENEINELKYNSGNNFWQSQVSDEVKDLIARMVQKDPRKRPTIE